MAEPTAEMSREPKMGSGRIGWQWVDGGGDISQAQERYGKYFCESPMTAIVTLSGPDIPEKIKGRGKVLIGSLMASEKLPPGEFGLVCTHSKAMGDPVDGVSVLRVVVDGQIHVNDSSKIGGDKMAAVYAQGGGESVWVGVDGVGEMSLEVAKELGGEIAEALERKMPGGKGRGGSSGSGSGGEAGFGRMKPGDRQDLLDSMK